MRESGIIMVVSFVLFILIVLGMMLFSRKPDVQYELKEIVAEQNFTFWRLFCDSDYYNTMSYEEALWIFKKDNNMSSYQVLEGQKILVRERVN